MQSYYSENGVTIYHGDCREVMRALAPDSVDAVVTDPPYHLTTGKKGGTGMASLNPNSPAGRARISTGFMGKTWDGGDVAHDPEVWIEALRVAKPGAHLLAFGGTRTFHRVMCAIEDAGWEIRDTIMWVFGSGFPKSLNVSEAREGWGTALKPAYEPIVLARKPLTSTVIETVLRYGTGAINIDGCRIECEPIHTSRNVALGSSSGGIYGTANTPAQFESHPNGRWPANFIHDGSEEVLAGFPDSDGDSPNRGPRNNGEFKSVAKGRDLPHSTTGHADIGSAARFFYCAKASKVDRDEGLEDVDARQRDDSRKEGNPGGDNPRNRGLAPRANHHPTVKPTDLMRYLVRLITPPGGTVLDMFCGSGSTGKAAVLEGCEFIGIDMTEEYCEMATKRIATAQKMVEAATRQGELTFA